MAPVKALQSLTLCGTANRVGDPSPSENLNLIKAWSSGGSFFFPAKYSCKHQAGLATQQNNVELRVESWKTSCLFFNGVGKCNHCSKVAVLT